MDQKASVGVAVIVGLVAGVVIGRVTAQKPQLDCTSPSNRTIRVNANGTLDCPSATISSSHQITWVAPAGMRLAIAFGQPSPFPNLTMSSNIADSGPVGPSVFGPSDPPGTKKTFLYTVSLNNGPPQPNGRIIIQK